MVVILVEHSHNGDVNMLNILHEKINEILPIVGVTQNSDGSYEIYYENKTPNADQQKQIDQIIQNFPIETLKIQKIEELDNNWKEFLKNGWETPYGWKLGIDNQDVTLLTGAFILAKEANSMGLSTTGTVIDMDGKSHELSLQDMTILMIQYGQFRSQLSSQYAVKRDLINNAVSIENLEQIIY
jgi:hypothetical protein